MSSLKSQTLWNFVPITATMITGLITVRLFLKYLSDDNYAIYFYVLSLGGVFGFMDLGIGCSVGRYIGMALGANDRQAVREYWGTGHSVLLPILLAGAVLFGLVGVIFGPHWFIGAKGHEPLLRECYIIGAAGLFVGFYFQTWNMLAQAHLDFAFTGVLNLIANLSSTVLCVSAAAWTGNPALVLAVPPLIGAIQLIALGIRARSRYGLGWNVRDFRMSRLNEMRGYCLRMFVNLLVGSFTGGFDKIAAGRVVPALSFKNYNIASNAGMRVQGVGAAIMNPTFFNTTRRMASHGLNGARDVYEEAVRMLGRFLIHGACVLAVWQTLLLTLWIGHQHATELMPVFYPITLAFLISALVLVSGAQMPALDWLNLWTGLLVLQAVMSAACVVAGWHFFGFRGLGYGLLAGRVVSLFQDKLTAHRLGAKGVWSWWGAREVALQAGVAGVFVLAKHYAGTWLPAQLFLLAIHGAYLPIAYFSIIRWKARRAISRASAV